MSFIPYTIRLVRRHQASPPAGLRQEWFEWQVRQGQKVLHRAEWLDGAARFALTIDPRPAGGERDVVTRCIDLILMDEAEIDEGFTDGLRNPEMEPGPNRSRAYWHGWHNARAKAGPDPSPGVPLVRDCRAVLGDDFLTILAQRRPTRKSA